MANSFEADPAVGSDPAVDLDWRVDSSAGISLVELTVTNSAGTPRRVRLGNRLDGPVCPPRREGVPEAGWDDGGFEGVLAPGERRALGYAARAPPADPPVEVVWSERAGDSETDGNRTEIDRPAVEATPEGVVRALGDARPPADAVPVPAVEDCGTPSDADPVPDPVDAWLSAVETRADDGTADLSEDDRRALDAVARRIGALRDRADESATGGSP
ncbi:hypothetical protein NGM10_09675 [Halorussus salilacus]|uniref:DUF7857 domain-containing protein n=1 Tax=Halorussus salilacus TaxID=2953750 RepID=UPI00209D7DFF|nr:hypothetical protein [Halorussus salilacus]USZ66997.1 hypothetical protein NGM10_09675 [Halorussus salilacus]